MTQLALFTSTFPFGRVEFLQDEIDYLAAAFDSVRLIPLRPAGSLVRTLPDNVSIDLTLADSIQPRGLLPPKASRTMVRAIGVARNADQSCLWREFARHGYWRSVRWIGHVGLEFSTYESVRKWASRSSIPDVAYTYWLGATTAALRSSWCDSIIVSRAHGGDIYPDRHVPKAIPFQEKSVAAASMIYPVSDHGARDLAQRFPMHSSKLSVQRLGIRDLGAPTPRSHDGVLRTISVSALDDNKRPLLLAEALFKVANEYPHVIWTHVGDGPLKQDLANLVARWGPSNMQLEFVGQVGAPQVHNLLQRGPFDVFVNVSRSEGVAVSLMEAQCLGIPTVATRVGGTPEVVSDDIDHLLRPNPSVHDVVEAIKKAGSSPSESVTIRHKRWKARYDESRNGPDFAARLLDLFQGPPDKEHR